MCGIAGILGKGNSEENIGSMLASIRHRGPDASGVYQDRECILGHNRLSIIDLSPNANQPFKDPATGLQLVFNGEIYNYKEIKAEIGKRYQFCTNSDTEVLLAAYLIFGKDCLSKLNGMFAFAIWDAQKRKLFAARDRFGVKPLYYSSCDGSFIFSSEIKAIRTIFSSQPDEETWANYFSYGQYATPETTFYTGIKQLPPGHFLEYQNEGCKVNKWYDFPKNIFEQPVDTDHSKIKDRYLDILESAIKLRFRSDVDLGFNLSGGVDSSLLLALVNHYRPSKNIKAYSFYTGNKRYDELPWVEKMIMQTKNPLEKVKLSVEEVPHLAKRISGVQDEPFGGIPTLAYAKLFQKASEQGVKVLLDGQGMDEQWAGYDYYATLSNSTIQGTFGKPVFFEGMLKKEFQNLSRRTEYPKPFGSEVQNLQYRDLYYTKLQRALRFNDRISMAFSTELREPFLDYRLVEFAFALPDNMKISNGAHKYLLREIIKDFVPFSISEAPKRPLQTPQREWLGNELQTFINESVDRLRNSKFQNWFDFDQINTELRNYKDGDQANSFHIWQLINASLLSDH